MGDRGHGAVARRSAPQINVALSTRSVAASIASNGSSPTSAAFIPTGPIFFAIALRGDRSYSLNRKIRWKL
jgi:hypothetical protein